LAATELVPMTEFAIEETTDRPRLNLVGLKILMNDTPNLGRIHKVPGIDCPSVALFPPLRRMRTNLSSCVH
jgi:hypothetical protein